MAGIDWSALPLDALEVISKLLTFDPDYIRYRSVCTSWRSAAPKLKPQLPWLIGHRKDDEGNHAIFSFFKFSPSGDQIIPIPEQPESSLFDGMTCRGSSHGWMALLDFSAPSIVLWNPVTKSKIQLPVLHQFTNFGRHKYSKVGEREYAHSFIDYHTKEEVTETLGFSDAEYYLANQVVLSSDPAASSDFVALVVCCRRSRLAFCRAGDEAWTPIPCPNFLGWTLQAVFFKGRFYLAAYGDVYACDLVGEKPRVEKIASVSLESSGLFEIDESHLVESGGDLLFVLAFYPDVFSCEPYQFDVFKLELGEQVKLVKLESLGDRALFLGRNHSFSIHASRVPGCRENSIYYTEIYYTLEERTAKKFRVCDLKDQSTVSIPSDEALPHPEWKPCLWFTPSLML